MGARLFIVDDGLKPVMSGDTSSVMPASLHISAICLSDSSKAFLELRLGRLAVQGGQVERGDSEMACEGGGRGRVVSSFVLGARAGYRGGDAFTVRVAPREQLREVVDLERLAAVGDVAVLGVARLEQLAADLELVHLRYRWRWSTLAPMDSKPTVQPMCARLSSDCATSRACSSRRSTL